MNQPSGSPTSRATLPAALESRVRFTLRGMLAGMMATSAFMAAAAPWSRQLNAEQHKALLLLSCNVAISAVATVVFSCVQRVRVERRAGAARYRLASSLSTSGAIFAAGAALFWSGSLVSYAFASVSLINARPQRVVFDFTAVQFGILLAASALELWWKTECLELCDSGVVRGCNFPPYKSIRGFRWGTSSPNLPVVSFGRSIVTLRAEPADRLAIEQFLRVRLSPPQSERRHSGADKS